MAYRRIDNSTRCRCGNMCIYMNMCTCMGTCGQNMKMLPGLPMQRNDLRLLRM